ncbi:MAG: hypothetical protein OMM_03657 [Candidatus Magnetoglobus multicellularis str. Araruama]|uniref:Uncharacterized protein n=1 Tax=Candidatus Magnetoglobus multicellularis str. Araruama TaxID=890399 RepID=A0A1V1P4X5_9BACT|nr:MAG: hypothetical protein OMM_03657 [Candidatus Magnetoglobus multicellularis str. Araruama]
MNKIETLRMTSKNWQKLYVPSGVIAFFCAFTFFWYFVQQYRFTNFWSFHWNLSIICIIACMSSSYGLVRLGQNDTLQRFFVFGFGIASFAFSLFLFVSWGVNQILGVIQITHFLGYLSLFTIFTASGVIAFIYMSSDYLRYPSYLFGLVNLVYIALLISKYIFRIIPYNWIFFIDNHLRSQIPINGADPHTWYIFIGEVIILMLGEIVFWALLFNGIEDPFEENM